MKQSIKQTNWLSGIKELKYNSITDFKWRFSNIKIIDILENSCFYLSAGADITPIVAFKDKIYSYVFSDLYLYSSIENIENKLNGILIKLKDRLEQQGFVEIQKFNIDNIFLEINERRQPKSNEFNLKVGEISFWEYENNIYSILYINKDNTNVYTELYFKNKIMPLAICEILPEGGTLDHNRIAISRYIPLNSIQKIKIEPQYVLGHIYSISNIENYIKLDTKIEYFGDYGPEYGVNTAMQIHQLKSE